MTSDNDIIPVTRGMLKKYAKDHHLLNGRSEEEAEQRARAWSDKMISVGVFDPTMSLDEAQTIVAERQ